MTSSRTPPEGRTGPITDTAMPETVWAGESASYTVEFINRSEQRGTVFLYQTNPTLSHLRAVPLIWLCADSEPATTTTFVWSERYSIFWSPTVDLAPGHVVVPAQRLRCGAGLLSGNEATFTGDLLTSQATGSPGGSIILFEAASIPHNRTSLGVCMSDAPILAFRARPNRVALITPKPMYRIGFHSQSAQDDDACDGATSNRRPASLRRVPPLSFPIDHLSGPHSPAVDTQPGQRVEDPRRRPVQCRQGLVLDAQTSPHAVLPITAGSRACVVTLDQHLGWSLRTR